jgi:hypothetical protein
MYAKQVSRIIEHFGDPVTGLVPPDRMPALNDALRRYQGGILPWARATAGRMIAEVNRRNLTAWQKHTKTMSAQLRQQLATTPLGNEVGALMDVQVDLITSLPLDAAKRVHEASLEAMTVGARFSSTAPEIKLALEKAHPDATDQWLRNRATLIARTETARVSSVLTQARATRVGSTHYIWKTAGDGNVRESHQRLDNTTQAWNEPPLSDPPGHHSHPGQIWNCRCIALPILADEQ